MELFIAIVLPLVLLFGLTLLLMSNRIPIWEQQVNRNNSSLWNFGIVVLTTMTEINNFAKR
tara:strand:+ start:317 stop:499 length:183 start_codon:yes stop_codon:yes gene_type:complete